MVDLHGLTTGWRGALAVLAAVLALFASDANAQMPTCARTFTLIGDYNCSEGRTFPNCEPGPVGMETTTTATYSGTGGQPVLSLGDKCAADTGGSVQAAGGGTCQYIKAGAMWQRAYHVLDYNNCSGLPSDCTPLKDKDAGRYTWDRQVAGSAPLTGGMGGPYYICSAFNNTGHACITLMTPDMAAVGPSYLSECRRPLE